MQRNIRMTLFILYKLLLLLPHHMIHGHGFSSDTLVQLNDRSWQTIHTICLRSLHNKISVSSYNIDTSCKTNQLVKSGRRSQSNCYMRLGFDFGFNDSTLDDIVCTPMQEFYMPETGKWAHAYTLQAGDTLLTKDNVKKPITYVQFVPKPLNIYTIEIKNSHTFFVGKHSILTHNMILPIAFSIGLSLPFGSVAGGAAGSFFGPIGLIGGVVLGGIIGLTAKAIYEDRIPTYNVPEYDIGLVKTYCDNAAYYIECANDLNHYVIQSSSNTAYESSFDMTVELGQESCNNIQARTPKEPEKDDEKDRVKQSGVNGKYENAAYHHKNSNGLKSPAPKNGQKALDNSLKIKKKNNSNRVALSEDEFVVLMEHSPDKFHGHVRTWSELDDLMRSTLIDAGLVTKKGKIIK